MGAWWEDFFSGPWAVVMREISGSDQAAVQAQQLVDLLGLDHGVDVLDAPCGEGRIALELAARGHRVTGLDLQERYLARAREQAAARSLDLRFDRGDLRELPYRDAFDLALCFWGSFGYFDAAGDRAQAEGYLRALRPGGRLLIDVFALEAIVSRFQTRAWFPIRDGFLLEDRHYDPLTGRMAADWHFAGEGGLRTAHSDMRIYGCAELVALLRDVGFDAFEAFGHLDGRPFEVGAPRLLLVAKRPLRAG